MNSFPRNIAACLLLTLVLTSTDFCQDAARERVAILPFTIQGISPEEGLQLRQRFGEVFAESNRFDVLPLTATMTSLEDAGWKGIDSCDSLPCLSQLGKILGVEKVVHVRVVHREGLYGLLIRLVSVDRSSLLYAERVDYSGEFGSMLSDIIPEQARKLTKAHLDAHTPWLPAVFLGVTCLGAILLIYSRFRRNHANTKSPGPRSGTET